MTFQHMLDVIRNAYQSFGFVPVETPVFELKDVLLTKSGGETEKQVYFVQSTGSLDQGYAADLALRFDLTVPLARYVAEHERDLAFPFRRYQMQRVYRGERAQRGRFREFYQCDIDVIGKDKLDPTFDAELPAIIVQIFTRLGLKNFTLHFSNRKILLGLLAAHGIADPETQKLALREIDKLDKIGREKVAAALQQLGLSDALVQQLLGLISLKASKRETLAALQAVAADHELFREGLAEVTQMVEMLQALGVPDKHTNLNLAIARGLDYYTGTVYETLIDDHPEFGSVCSGGRYENLASFYTKSKLPGVGLSIGATRLFDQLRAHNLLPDAPNSVQVLITRMDASLANHYLATATALRQTGLNVETWLEGGKFDKQLRYADKAGIPLAVIIGADEAAKGTAIIKDLRHKTQRDVPQAELATALHELLRREA